ncbi:transposase [Streptomyces sp. 2231.1]|uniref:transposase n=1 Tax=Streptomyces sp. 2231.1 TaxID=1855347 RepID=UPI000AC9A726|nr:transposase [Streptomyces sp. 2231.1]
MCGRELTGWYVLDLDATIVTCTSRKEGAAGTFKGSFGHMPLGAWVANICECVAMLLRPGNAPPNDVADHRSVLAAALRQLALPLWSKLLIRIDGAAFSHDVLDHLQQLTTSRRRVRWVTGWAVNATDEQAIALLPEHVWTAALRQDGEVHEIKGSDGEWLTYQVAELTGLRDLTGWPKGMRLIVCRVKPSRRDAKKLTVFEKRTGWRYQIIATNIPAHQGLSSVPGSGQVWFIDALYRDHAEVEDRVKAIKRVGLGLLPSKSWQLNAAWVLAATIAADIDAWIRLLVLRDEPELATAEPETIRMKLYHLPPGSPPTPAGAPCTWTAPGPGPPRSPPPGSGPPGFRPSPDGRPPPRRHQNHLLAALAGVAPIVPAEEPQSDPAAIEGRSSQVDESAEVIACMEAVTSAGIALARAVTALRAAARDVGVDTHAASRHRLTGVRATVPRHADHRIPGPDIWVFKVERCGGVRGLGGW